MKYLDPLTTWLIVSNPQFDFDFLASIPLFFIHAIAAAGNFLCPASSLSSNAFKTGTVYMYTIVLKCDGIKFFTHHYSY